MKVTVITVCLNSEKSIERTIKSVINQDYKNVQYIIIDGGSKDSTVSIINKYKDSIEKIVSEKDDGIYTAINKGIKFADGDIISILHSDDIFFNKNILSEVVQHFKNNKFLDCIIGTTLMKNKLNNQILRKYSPINFKKWMMYLGISPPHPSMFLRSFVYKKHGLYKENYRIASDFDFYLRVLFINKINYKLMDNKYVIMNYGGASTKSFNSNIVASKEILNSFRENNIYNNYLLILLRFPFKIFQFIFKK